MQKEDDWDSIFNDDPFGLLKPKATNPNPVINEDQRLIQSFQEILDFVNLQGQSPNPEGSILEKRLYMRLKGFINDPQKREFLRPYDSANILNTVLDQKVESIEDILSNDPLGLLASAADTIFDLKHVPKETTMPEYVASRKPCLDFSQFEALFIQCHADLKMGDRKLLPFRNEQQIEKGAFFVLKGMMLYVAELGKKELENGKTNARLRCIFENGTESDMLLRSLAAELYKDGRRITEHKDKVLEELLISEDDKATGFLYVLKSLSQDPAISTIPNLYKIGFSTTAVEDRIKNAAKEPTYLMAPVKVISSYACYNFKPQKLELLLHRFFGKACLELDVFDEEGHRFTPREWFIAPLNVIEETIHLILDGRVTDFHYDPESQRIKLN
jgi:hypothetical protein